MAIEQTGLEFVAENFDAFKGAINDATSALTGFESVGDAVGGTFDAMGEIVTGALRHIGTIAVDTFIQAAGAAKDFLGDALGEALDAEKNIASLNATIKSTGGAAGLTSEEAQELAMRFRDLAGGSDDAVLSIEEVALRAGTISKDELPDFIKHTFDLAQVMGSAEAAATLLARSEEDPVAAMGKAQRAGIVFTQTLKDQIKQLQKDGKLKEANALFTERLAEATSGLAASAAETTSGKWEILVGHFKEVEEVVGSALIPAFNTLFDQVLTPAMPIIEGIGTSIANVIKLLTTGDFSGGIFGLQEDNPLINGLFVLRDIGMQVINWIMNTALPTLASLANWFFNDGVYAIQEFIDNAWASLQSAFNTIMPIIQPVITALQALWIALKTDDPEAFFRTLNALASNIVDAFGKLWELIRPHLEKMWDSIVAWVTSNLPMLQKEFSKWTTAAWSWIKDDIWPNVLKPKLDEFIDKIVTWIKNDGFNMLWENFKTWRETAVDWADDVYPKLAESLGEMLGKIVNWILSDGLMLLAGAFVGLVVAIGKSLLEIIGLRQPDYNEAGNKFVSGFIKGFEESPFWNNLQNKVSEKVMELTGPIQEALINVGRMIFGGFGVGWDIVRGIADGIRAAGFYIFSALWDVVNGAIENIKRLFGIHSPSEKTGNVLGEPLGEGVAVGIMESMDKVIAAFQAITMQPLNMISSQVGSGQYGGGGNTSYSNSRTNVLNVNSSQSSQGIISDFAILEVLG